MGRWMLRVKANLPDSGNHGWREKVCPGGQWSDGYGKAAARAIARGLCPSQTEMKRFIDCTITVVNPRQIIKVMDDRQANVSCDRRGAGSWKLRRKAAQARGGKPMVR